MMGAENAELGFEEGVGEDLVAGSLLPARKMQAFDSEHIGSLAAVAESLSPGSKWRRALTSVRVVIFQAKINVLLPFGPLAVMLHYLPGKHVLNHGIPVELMLAVMAVAHEFFRLPPEEKAKLYSDDPAKKIRLSTSFNVRKETVHNWRDYLRLHCHPLEQFVPDWPANPPPFREIVSTYCKEVRELGFRLYGAISESLGLEESYIKKVLGEQEQHMAVNFYPKCPEPDLTYGLPAHTDPNALTILLMDQQVAGLQVLKEGKWIAVNPRPNALVINIGDQLQALSNGRYKSVWHRAVVNSDRARMSIASFLCPCNDVLIGPAEKLISEDSTAVYRNYTYDEYYKKFWSRNLDQEHCLEFFRT